MKNFSYFIVGFLILLANKVRYAIFGYRQPRVFGAREIEKATEYARSVAANYYKYLRQYLGNDDLNGKNILELGPGADLGVGLLMLANGAQSHCALDANRLIDATPAEFYEQLLDEFDENRKKQLLAELELAQQNKGRQLNYHVDKNFSPRIFLKKFDCIFSHAAFEHFDDSEKVIKEISEVSAPGAVFVATIDPKTHSRPINISDPLNIYRYPNWFYRAARYSGIPNRWRPKDYIAALKKYGFDNIQAVPLTLLSPEKLKKVLPKLNRRFQNADNQMEILDFMLLATKS